MTGLLLGDREQAALRAVVGSEPQPGPPGQGVLAHVTRLVACDRAGVAVLDGAGAVLEQATLPHGRAGTGPPAFGPGVLSLSVHDGGGHRVVLWLVRAGSDFGERDRALLGLVAPALRRLLRERPPPPCSLTAQEQRVLEHLARGRTNAEIAEVLVLAPSTVGKHLENAYRKLGVTNRLAAVCAAGGLRPVAGSRAGVSRARVSRAGGSRSRRTAAREGWPEAGSNR
jgi:DNA-binding CsgD family transcriptional regulator